MKYLQWIFVMLCVFLFLTGCSAQEKIVVQPTSLEELHYQIDVDSVPKSVREDSFFGNQEDFEIPNLVGTYTALSEHIGIIIWVLIYMMRRFCARYRQTQPTSKTWERSSRLPTGRNTGFFKTRISLFLTCPQC